MKFTPAIKTNLMPNGFIEVKPRVTLVPRARRSTFLDSVAQQIARLIMSVNSLFMSKK